MDTAKIRKSGWVRKQSRWWKEYRFRYAVLEGTKLSTYKKCNYKEETENIDVTQCNAVYDITKTNQFMLESKTSPTLQFILICKSDKDCNEWLKHIYIAQQSAEKEVELRPISGSDLLFEDPEDSHIYDLVLQSISELDEPMLIGLNITPHDGDNEDAQDMNATKETKEPSSTMHEHDDISTSMQICSRCQHLSTSNSDNCANDDQGLALCLQCTDAEECSSSNEAKAEDSIHSNDNEVAQWLMHEVQLPQYVDMFTNHGFDELQTIIRNMSDSMLVDIGVQRIGHRLKIMDCICERRSKQNKIIADSNELKFALDVEQCNKLQLDFEHYQHDCLQSAKLSLPELTMFAPIESLVIRQWCCLKTEYFQRVLDDHMQDTDSDGDSDNERSRFLYELLFETIVSCDAVLRAIYERVKNEYVHGRPLDLVLLNIDILYKQTKKAKHFKRFENIAMFIKRQIIEEIMTKLDSKFQNAQDDYLIEFTVQCCKVLWPVIGYGYQLSPGQFAMGCEYDSSIHALHDQQGNETSATRFCVFPALHKENAFKTKMWVVCERE